MKIDTIIAKNYNVIKKVICLPVITLSQIVFAGYGLGYKGEENCFLELLVLLKAEHFDDSFRKVKLAMNPLN